MTDALDLHLARELRDRDRINERLFTFLHGSWPFTAPGHAPPPPLPPLPAAAQAVELHLHIHIHLDGQQ